MDIDFKLNTTKTHFNATAILQQVNTDFAMKKRFNEFAKQTKIKLTCQSIDAARVDYLNRTKFDGPRTGHVDKVRIPSISVVGGGYTKSTWLHLSLLPIFLHWLHPQVYARFFSAPQAVAVLGRLGAVGEI